MKSEKRALIIGVCIFISFFMFLVFSTCFTLAQPLNNNVAYITTAKIFNPDIAGVFSELGLNLTLIPDYLAPSKNLSKYRMVFIDDVFLAKSKNLPVYRYPAVIMNKYYTYQWGLTDYDGASQIASTSPLQALITGDGVINVYTQAKDYQTSTSIPYYYLDDLNKAPVVESIARVFTPSVDGSTLIDFGDAIGAVQKGTILKNGQRSGGKICFYGFAKTPYWTPEARELFKQCVASVLIECRIDAHCDDQNSSNIDICNNPGTVDSYCSHLPIPACRDGVDNDHDGLIDIADPGCHIDGNASNGASYNSSDTDEYNPPIVCSTNSQCGLPSSGLSCNINSLVNTTLTPTCFNSNTTLSYCSNVSSDSSNVCLFECSNGACLPPKHDVSLINVTGDGLIKITNTSDSIIMGELRCNMNYKIYIKARNNGDFIENITYNGSIDGLSFNHEQTLNLIAGDSTSDKVRTLNLTLGTGFYNITVQANIPGDVNPSDNIAVKQIYVNCTFPQCSDGIDNDGDGLIDIADPGCHTDGNPANISSYDPNDDNESNPPIICNINSDCGTDSNLNDFFCDGGSGRDLWQHKLTFTCNNPGTIFSFCSNSTIPVQNKTCAFGCFNGSCLNENIPPVITLIFPPDYYNTTNPNINFVYNVTDDSLIHNCRLILDGDVVMVTSPIIDTTNSFSRIVALGDHIWKINCTDIYNNTGTSETRHLKILELPQCSTDRDCGLPSSSLSCDEDNLVNTTITPTCTIGTCNNVTSSTNILCELGCNSTSLSCNQPNLFHDVAIAITSADYVNGIKITQNGTVIEGNPANLRCNQSFVVNFKVKNNGNFTETINVTGKIDGFSWQQSLFDLNSGITSTDRTKTISTLFAPGLYQLNITALIQGFSDSNPFDNFASRQIQITCQMNQTCIDNDHDGYNQSAEGCGPADCNDNNAGIHPGATEICNGIDDDCDSQVDEGLLGCIICSKNSDCGTNGPTGNLFCDGDNSMQNHISFTCNNPGTTSSYCSNSTTPVLNQECDFGCSNGICNNQPSCMINNNSGNIGSFLSGTKVKVVLSKVNDYAYAFLDGNNLVSSDCAKNGKFSLAGFNQCPAICINADYSPFNNADYFCDVHSRTIEFTPSVGNHALQLMLLDYHGYKCFIDSKVYVQCNGSPDYVFAGTFYGDENTLDHCQGSDDFWKIKRQNGLPFGMSSLDSKTFDFNIT